MLFNLTFPIILLSVNIFQALRDESSEGERNENAEKIITLLTQSHRSLANF